MIGEPRDVGVIGAVEAVKGIPRPGHDAQATWSSRALGTSVPECMVVVSGSSHRHVGFTLVLACLQP